MSSPRLVGVDDLLDVLGAQVVLRLALAVFAVGVDEQHMPCRSRRLRLPCPEHQDAGGDAGAVEQVRRQADDGLQQAVLR